MRLNEEFFARSCLDVAPELVGKIICHRLPDGELRCLRITETEAYNGEDDTACHASKGKTARNEVLWKAPGTIYVYLCYGMHWMLNAITGREGVAEGVLIRACENYAGPGKLTKYLQIDKSLNKSSFLRSEELWIEDDGYQPDLRTDARIGINYAAPEDRERRWRFIDIASEQKKVNNNRNRK